MYNKKFKFVLVLLVSLATFSCGENYQEFDALTSFSKNIPNKIDSKNYIEEDDEKINFIGEWNKEKDSNASNNFVKTSFLNSNNSVSEVRKNKIEYKFVGDNIEFIATKDNKQGIAEIYLDKSFQCSFDLFSEVTLNKKSIFSKSKLENKEHLIEIIPSGEKNIKSKSLAINFDAFVLNNFNQTSPDLAILPNGDFILVWVNKIDNENGEYIYAQKFDSTGNKKGSLIKVNSLKEKFEISVSKPQIIIDDKNEFKIAWLKTKNVPGIHGMPWEKTFAIYIRKFDSENIPFEIEKQLYPTKEISYSEFSKFSIENINSNALAIIFEKYSDIYASISGLEKSYLNRDFKLDNLGGGFSTVISKGKNKNFIISASSFIKNEDWISSLKIAIRKFDNNFLPLGSEFIVSDRKKGRQSKSSINTDSQENIIISWDNDVYMDNIYTMDIYAKIFDKNLKPITKDFLVNTTTIGEQRNSKVLIDSKDNIIFLWENYKNFSYANDNPSSISGQIFDNTGKKIGKEFQITTDTPSFKYNMVSKILNDKIYIAWEEKRKKTDQIGEKENISEICYQLLDINDLYTNKKN